MPEQHFQRRFRVRFPRDKTALQWATANPLLSSGEPGVEDDTGLFKIGDGVRLWNDLPYAGAAINSGFREPLCVRNGQRSGFVRTKREPEIVFCGGDVVMVFRRR